MKVKGIEEVIHEVLKIIDNNKNYLNRNNFFITTQQEIRFDKLFKGFIIKDWINRLKEYRKYILQNEMIIAKYIKHYAKYWED